MYTIKFTENLLILVKKLGLLALLSLKTVYNSLRNALYHN
jgi:hypothetical protein